jgi:hypothetical protein
MRGQLDNSTEWLRKMPASAFSTQHHADRLSEAMRRKTGVPWIVKLVPLEENMGGGFTIQPEPDRLVEGCLSTRDWGHLQALFGAIPHPARRWYLFPDEIGAALLNIGVKPVPAPASSE